MTACLCEYTHNFIHCICIAWQYIIYLCTCFTVTTFMNGEGKSHRRLSDEDYHSPAILTDQPLTSTLYQVSESRQQLNSYQNWLHILGIIKNWLHILRMCCITQGAKCFSCARSTIFTCLVLQLSYTEQQDLLIMQFFQSNTIPFHRNLYIKTAKYISLLCTYE